MDTAAKAGDPELSAERWAEPSCSKSLPQTTRESGPRSTKSSSLRGGSSRGSLFSPSDLDRMSHVCRACPRCEDHTLLPGVKVPHHLDHSDSVSLNDTNDQLLHNK